MRDNVSKRKKKERKEKEQNNYVWNFDRYERSEIERNVFQTWQSLYERMSSSSSDEEHSDQTQRLVPGTAT